MRKSVIRRLAVARLAAAALTLLAAPAFAQTRAELEKVIRRQVLPNGLEVIVVENHGVPIATVEIDVKNGAFTQSPDYAGLAHMYEHMFFKASKDYPDPEQFTQRATELGAQFNGSTKEEVVNYYLTLPADSAKAGMRFLASSLRAPLFRDDELAAEKEVVLGEYDRNEAGPGFAFSQKMTELLYPGQFSRKNTIGDREVLRTVTPAKMREIQTRYYLPNNSALVVTGDVTPDSVFAWARAFYGDWEKGPDPFVANPIPPIPAIPQSQGVISEAPVSAVTVLIQWQGPSVRKDPASTYAADVFSDALNSEDSRFQKRLVDSGLWQGVVVNYYTLDQNGPISISGQTSPDKLRRALAALYDEIAKTDDPGYFSADELKRVKAQRAVESAFGAERTSGLTHTVGFWWAVADLDYFMGYVDNMAMQTPEDLRRYAARYIVGKPRIAGVLLSPQARASLGLKETDLVGPASTSRTTP
ncbi:peptidase M16 domain protein [Gemmatirosa kalamazoonensis]|uniref:Peptidase M16 domain protein n=1 Tax=Gemmatirosa kalamazoonensis TaxID=861299 RepID=W0RED4_9BACT|nr:pitrilysin family protein [Gemmatirosa kalamazoonensis]AHG88797.1 peptidase M16 domain protein [Gemmatirosa kalamazoonensis]